MNEVTKTNEVAAPPLLPASPAEFLYWTNASLSAVTDLRHKVGANGAPYVIGTATAANTRYGPEHEAPINRVIAFGAARIALVEGIAASGGELFGRIEDNMFVAISLPRTSDRQDRRAGPRTGVNRFGGQLRQAALSEMALIVETAETRTSAKGKPYVVGKGRIGPEQRPITLKAFGAEAMGLVQPGFAGTVVGELSDHEFRVVCMPRHAVAA